MDRCWAERSHTHKNNIGYPSTPWDLHRVPWSSQLTSAIFTRPFVLVASSAQTVHWNKHASVISGERQTWSKLLAMAAPENQLDNFIEINERAAYHGA